MLFNLSKKYLEIADFQILCSTFIMHYIMVGIEKVVEFDDKLRVLDTFAKFRSYLSDIGS